MRSRGTDGTTLLLALLLSAALLVLSARAANDRHLEAGLAAGGGVIESSAPAPRGGR